MLSRCALFCLFLLLWEFCVSVVVDGSLAIASSLQLPLFEPLNSVLVDGSCASFGVLDSVGSCVPFVIVVGAFAAF